MEEEQWWEERNGRLYCKEDGTQLQQVYGGDGNHRGRFIPPTFECPKCKREVAPSLRID
jgi:hypothetical protein